MRLDVLLVEHIGGAEVKRTAVRYTIQVLEQRIDPEFNPWGLYLDRIVRPAERLPK